MVELLEAGANVAMATDGSAPYFSLDLWKELSRTMFTHRILKSDMAVLPPGKALRMVTIDAAKVLNLEHEIGSLEVGKKADIILVDLRRPHLTPHASIPSLLAYYATGNDVETTIIDGKIVMENRVVKTVDEPRDASAGDGGAASRRKPASTSPASSTWTTPSGDAHATGAGWSDNASGTTVEPFVRLSSLQLRPRPL